MTSEQLKNAALNGAFKLIGHLPLALLRSLGAMVGLVLWLGNGRATKVTRKNLQLCFPALDEAARERLVKQSLMHTVQNGFEMIRFWIQPDEKNLPHIKKIVNRDVFQRGAASGKGLLILTPHLGNWEIVGQWCATELRGMTILYQPPKQAVLEPIIKNARERGGNKLFPTDASGVKAVLRALKKGGFSGVLPDQEPEREGGVFVPFFGVSALSMTLVHGLVSRTGCDVVLAYAKRVPGGFELVFRDAEAELYSGEQRLSVAALNRSVEHCINDCPEQYQWEYKRFKRRPSRTEKFYKF